YWNKSNTTKERWKIMKKSVSDWHDLVGLESATHRVELGKTFADEDYDHGYLVPKNENTHELFYLSTHTFYKSTQADYQRMFNVCGFNIKLICE
ncbi:MAG: hypothetical protein ACRCRT_04175, partial [Cetobacterium somerae]